MSPQKNADDPIICRCNHISRSTIETAIRNGADTLNKIFDATTAGVGPCGGSCRRKIAPLLEAFLKDGQFPPPAKAPSPHRHPRSRSSPHKKRP